MDDRTVRALTVALVSSGRQDVFRCTSIATTLVPAWAGIDCDRAHDNQVVITK